MRKIILMLLVLGLWACSKQESPPPEILNTCMVESELDGMWRETNLSSNTSPDTVIFNLSAETYIHQSEIGTFQGSLLVGVCSLEHFILTIETDIDEDGIGEPFVLSGSFSDANNITAKYVHPQDTTTIEIDVTLEKLQ